PGVAARQAARAAEPASWLGSIGSVFAEAVGGLFGDPPAQDHGFVATEGDKILCQDHPPQPDQLLAQGSSHVFINGQPAVRVSDKSTCDGKVSINAGHQARRNVSIGGDTVQVRDISSEMPPWLDRISRYAGLAIGLCQALRGKGPLLGKVSCFLGNMALSMGADAAVRGTGRYLSGLFGHPVHVPSGAKVLDGEHDQDFALAARLPLQWTRRYHSGNPRAGLFGPGWMVIYDVALHLEQPDPGDPQACHVFIDPQGRAIPLPALQPGEKFLAAQEGLTFAHTAGGHYMLRFADGLVIDFGPAQAAAGTPAVLRPWALEDRNGNAHYLRYDGQGRLAGLCTDCGLQLRLDYGADHPDRVQAIRQRLAAPADAAHPQSQRTLVQYAYDAQGRLAEVCNGAGELLRRFAYDAHGRMTMQRLPHGLEVHYRWQPAGDSLPTRAPARVAGWHTSAGEQVDLDYELAADGSGSARSRDTLGRSHAWAWDALGRVTGYTDPLGGRFALTWAEQERQVLSVTNPAGGITRFSYDERGNLARQTDPLGRHHATLWHADLAEPLQHTGPDGACWTWHYDAVGNLVQEDAPGGLQQRWTHDRHGAVLAHTDARGGVRHYGHDPHGRLLQATDCSARRTRYEYDAWGQLRREIDAAGQATEVRHDEAGRVAGVTLPDGTHWAWQWSADGRPLAQAHIGAP
ncbi:MAG TPA: DUF6531 domain-containing protein, partial [Burkholderiaceae bacterium]|nr:DUF6531 domain-containing protein [Burkholderiaceae bacterium]